MVSNLLLRITFWPCILFGVFGEKRVPPNQVHLQMSNLYMMMMNRYFSDIC